METKLMGRPPHDPTTESRAQVTRLSSLGVTHQHMAILLGITPKTLRKHYRKELAASSIDANVKVLETLYAMATSGKSAVASIFWARTRCGLAIPEPVGKPSIPQPPSSIVVLNNDGAPLAD